MFKNLTIRGQFMYEREDARGIIELTEVRVLRLGKSGGQTLWDNFHANQNPEADKIVLFTR